MHKIETLKNKSGESFYPLTSTKAVVDENGNTIEGRLVVADGEDLVTDGNVLRLKDRPNTDGMGYVILRKDKTFQEQVTKPNTIYEIRYDFDLNGAEITIPENCVLKFEGGSLRNGVVVGNGTTIQYCGKNQILDVNLKGSWMSDFKSSWLSTNPTILANSITSIFNKANKLILNCDITTIGLNSDCASVYISGNGHTWNSPMLFKVCGNIYVNDIVFTNCSDKVFSPSNKYNSATVDFINVVADGSNVATAFYHNNTKIFNTKDAGQDVILNMTGCKISGFITYGIRCSCFLHDSIIRNNKFSRIGEENGAHGAVALYIGDDLNQTEGAYTARNIEITNNTFDVVVGNYEERGDVREIHAILLYGEYCKVSNNTVEGVSTKFDEIIDTGADAEAIYLKSRHSKVTGNYVKNGAGKTSDGAISLKGKNEDNIVADNTVITEYWGKSIIAQHGISVIIRNNTLVTVGTSISIFVNNIESAQIEANSITCTNAIFLDRNGIVSSACNNLIVRNNIIKNCIPAIQLYDVAAVVKNNEIEAVVPDEIIPTGQYPGIVSLRGIEVDSIVCESNKIKAIGLKNYAIYLNKTKFEDNRCVLHNQKAEYYILPDTECSIKNNTFDLNTDIPLNRKYSAGKCTVTGNLFRHVLPQIYGLTVDNNTLLNNVVGEIPKNPSIGVYLFDLSTKTPLWYDGKEWIGFPSPHIQRAGTWSQRPNADGSFLDNGFQYFLLESTPDEDPDGQPIESLTGNGKPIWWIQDSRKWVDALGNTITGSLGITKVNEVRHLINGEEYKFLTTDEESKTATIYAPTQIESDGYIVAAQSGKAQFVDPADIGLK